MSLWRTSESRPGNADTEVDTIRFNSFSAPVHISLNRTPYIPDCFADPVQLLYNLRPVTATVAQLVEQLIRNQ